MKHVNFLLLLLLLSVVCEAQSISKIRLLITDSQDGKITSVDTIVSANSNMNEVLEKLGYAQDNIAQMQSDHYNRRITIATEEIIDKQGNTSTSTQYDRKIAIENTNASKLNIEDIMNIPKDAVVTENPDGSKHILIQRTDANGKTTTEERTISIGKSERLSDRSGRSSTWMNMEKGAPLPPTVDGPLNWTTESFSNISTDPSTSSMNVSVTVADCDMFDASTFNKLDPSLVSSKAMTLQGFKVKPDFKEGYFRFSFSMPNNEISNFRIFDVVGNSIHQESFSGNFDKLVTPFHIHKKGTFLILINQDGKKWSQKVTIN
ncbi:MAG: hypothetical protein ACPG5B_07315 [Chitinophagales bacterium]